jgi:hypothetical protein
MISVIMPGTESIFFGYMLTLDCQWICKIFWQKSKLKIMARNVQFKDTTGRRLVGFKFVSFLKQGVDLTHRRYIKFAFSLDKVLLVRRIKHFTI